MKEKIEKLYIDALYNDVAPNVFAEQVLDLFIVSKPSIDKIEPKGSWFFERSSGYAGFRCQKCSTWIYEEQPKKCTCDNAG